MKTIIKGVTSTLAGFALSAVLLIAPFPNNSLDLIPTACASGSECSVANCPGSGVNCCAIIEEGKTQVIFKAGGD